MCPICLFYIQTARFQTPVWFLFDATGKVYTALASAAAAAGQAVCEFLLLFIYLVVMKQLQRSKISYKVCVLVGLHHHTVWKFLFEPAVSNSIFLFLFFFKKLKKENCWKMCFHLVNTNLNISTLMQPGMWILRLIFSRFETGFNHIWFHIKLMK